MLTITIPEREVYDEEKNEFFTIKETTLTLEHSLKSMYKWEAKWHKPYLSKTPKTIEEAVDYIRCMTLTQNVDPNIYYYIPEDIIKQIADYIDDPMTATTIWSDNNSMTFGGRRETMTAEVIYYYMAANYIWLDWEKRHLNQLLMLLKVCSEKNKPDKKMSKSSLTSKYAALNAARRSKYRTKG